MSKKRSIKCFVHNCSSVENAEFSDPEVSFYRFPKVGKFNVRRCQLFAQFGLPGGDWSNKEDLLKLYNSNKHICSRHFQADAFSEVHPSRLNQFSIPTIYPLAAIPSDPPVSNSLPSSRSAHIAPGTPTLSADAHIFSPIQAVAPDRILDDEVQIEEIPNSLQFLQKDSNNSGIENANSTIKIVKIESVKVCRLCMKAMTDAKNIFEEYIDVNVPIYLGVNVCLYPIMVSTGDPLSKYICSECFNMLSSFAKFREIVLRNDEIQRRCLKDNISKNTTAEKRHIDTENEPHLMKKIKVNWRPEQVESFGISNQPKLSNKDEDKRNILKENGNAPQPVSKSTIQLNHTKSSSANSILFSTLDQELQERTNNKEQEEKALPNTIILKENLKLSDSKLELSYRSQTTYDHNPFTLANGYLMEHKLVKGNLRYLKCALAQCPAVGTQEVLIPGLFKSTVSYIKGHNHKKPTEIDIRKQKLISVIRKKLQLVGGSSIKSIYDEVCKLDPDLAPILAMEDLMKDICNL